MQYAWTKATVCVDMFLINTIASFLQALTGYIDKAKQWLGSPQGLTSASFTERHQLHISNTDIKTNISLVMIKTTQVHFLPLVVLTASHHSVTVCVLFTISLALCIQIMWRSWRVRWPAWTCRFSDLQLCITVTSKTSSPAPRSDCTSPPLLSPSPSLSLGVPQSWAHHGRMLLQTQTR